MKKGKILNKDLNNAISSMGHGDFIIISDAGFPIPDGKRVDLAITQDLPGIIETLELITDDFIYERVIVAEEQRKYNPLLYGKVESLCDRCDIEKIPHEQLMREFPEKAKYIVRTGACEPWGNIILCSGVDAAYWFQKEGAITPDYYKSRAEYKEK